MTDDVNLDGVDHETLFGHNETQELDLGFQEGTLIGIQKKALLLQDFEGYAEVLKVFVATVTENQHAVEVDDKEFSYERFEDMGHYTHKVGWGICQPNGITNNSYKPSLVLMAIFHSSPSWMRT